jgi:5-methylcytosine-specific restriction endonuclease McrA
MIAIKKNPLSKLSDSQIIKRLDALVQKERETTLEILRHLIEMDLRSLYLGRGYGSLFEYCTRHLGYSESAAGRRIKTARCIRDFPEIYEMLSKNELNISTVSKLAVTLTEENRHELLEEVRCRSARQVDAILARYRPMIKLRDRVRTVYVKKSVDAAAIEKASKTEKVEKILFRGTHSVTENQSKASCKSGKILTADVGGRTFTTCANQKQRTSILEKKYKLEFAVGPDFMKKLEEAKVILSRKYPQGVPFEQLFELMLNEFLEKHCPKRKIQRREKRKAKQRAKKNLQQDKPSKGKKTKNTKTMAISKTENPRIITATRTKYDDPRNNTRSRHIPIAIKDEVFARGEGRCTFVGPDGVRCDSPWNLEIDHIKPYAKEGDHSIHNLRLLCGRHNQYEAERVYGKNFMERRITKAKPVKT